MFLVFLQPFILDPPPPHLQGTFFPSLTTFSRLACLGRNGCWSLVQAPCLDARLDGVFFAARRGDWAPPPPDQLAAFYKLVDKKSDSRRAVSSRA